MKSTFKFRIGTSWLYSGSGSALPMPWMQVQSLVGELDPTCHVVWQKKKKKKKNKGQERAELS